LLNQGDILCRPIYGTDGKDCYDWALTLLTNKKHHHSIRKLSSGSSEKSSDRTVTSFGIPKQFYIAPKMFATPANIFGMAQNIFEIVNQSLYVTNDLNG
jgi:hypothetical protein